MEKSIIKLEGINRDFFDGRVKREILKNINLDISPGELTIIAGPSGSGKTTLLSIMGLILEPSEGRIFITGKEVSGFSQSKLASLRLKYFGFVFQQSELIPALTVLENILVANSIQGKSVSAEVKKRAIFLLEDSGLKDYSNAKPRQLSSGQKQLVAIARAMINEPVLLLCDEPTSALDSENSTKVLEKLKLLSKDPERGIILITHDPRVFPYGDRLIKIENGAIGYDSIYGSQEGVLDEKVI